MVEAPYPVDEEDRLKKLGRYEILDTATEQDYDDIARLTAEICNTPLSTISFVDRDRQWFKASVGIQTRETSRDVAFCAHTILGDDLFTVKDASTDPRFEDNPLVTIDPRLKFYAGMPLVTPDGFRLGALCAIDRVPRVLTPQQEESLRILSRHVVHLLELRYSRNQLQQLSDLKSRLMSIMAHDLRSPLASIQSILNLFRSDRLQPAEQQEVLDELGKVLDGTKYLLDNVIGWASRSLETTPFEFSDIDLPAFARELADSMDHDLRKKDNALNLDLGPSTGKMPAIRSDRNILVFVIRNLLANANKFTSQGVITLHISREISGAVFRVCDTGIGMSEQQQNTLFDWSTRSRRLGTSGEKGAGLALLFCRDFVGRLGGTLSVESSEGAGTCMNVAIPDLTL
ncbi:MAG: sensor histidine kinase [Spirochaetaceae bacterium]|nr:MAG: sensor histidine kinase [Spirochaetaceae bacterium]